jgi:hypothetical protein
VEALRATLGRLDVAGKDEGTCHSEFQSTTAVEINFKCLFQCLIEMLTDTTAGQQVLHQPQLLDTCTLLQHTTNYTGTMLTPNITLSS